MVEKEDNQIKITIFGQEYSVKATADPTYIKNIAEYVDTKMREVQSGFSSTQSSNWIAILSAMNISDELFNAKKKGDSDNNEVEEKITSLIEFIDESVQLKIYKSEATILSGKDTANSVYHDLNKSPTCIQEQINNISYK